jgi:hypothetical protein
MSKPSDTRPELEMETDPALFVTENRSRDLPAAARRALAEAEERRRKAKAVELAPELGGRDGPEPVRYGDWEKKGIAIDF